MSVSAHDVGQLIRDRGVAEPTSLISILSEIQDRYHYLPYNVLVLLSETFDIPLSQIYSVAIFYNEYSLKPRGVHLVRVCMGTACHVRGAAHILNRLESKPNIRAGETTRDRNVTLKRSIVSALARWDLLWLWMGHTPDRWTSPKQIA